MCTFVPSNVQIYIQSGYAWIFSIIHTVSLPIPFRQHEGKFTGYIESSQFQNILGDKWTEEKHT